MKNPPVPNAGLRGERTPDAVHPDGIGGHSGSDRYIEMDTDFVVLFLAGAVAALLWNRPEIRPFRLLCGVILLATGILSVSWVTIVLGILLLGSSVRSELILPRHATTEAQRYKE
jgi:hypothetical protein